MQKILRNRCVPAISLANVKSCVYDGDIFRSVFNSTRCMKAIARTNEIAKLETIRRLFVVKCTVILWFTRDFGKMSSIPPYIRNFTLQRDHIQLAQ